MAYEATVEGELVSLSWVRECSSFNVRVPSSWIPMAFPGRASCWVTLAPVA